MKLFEAAVLLPVNVRCANRRSFFGAPLHLRPEQLEGFAPNGLPKFIDGDGPPSENCISMPTTFNELIKLLVTKLQRAVSTRYQIVHGDGPSDDCISTPTTHL